LETRRITAMAHLTWNVSRRLLAALAAAAALAGPAQAAFVQGDWDPPFGPPFPDLGWRGTTTIEVPLACLSLSGVIVNDGSLCPLMTVVNAEVQFYDVADTVPTVETLDFDALVAVDRIFVLAGVVEAFALDSLGFVFSNSPLGVTTPPPGAQAFFGLEVDFVIGSGTEAVLAWKADDGAEGGRSSPDFPAYVRITQTSDPAPVPVPATLALTLAGLVLLGGTRRRG
jgi:MYXO-CTERM domain-containing protein